MLSSIFDDSWIGVNTNQSGDGGAFFSKGGKPTTSATTNIENAVETGRVGLFCEWTAHSIGQHLVLDDKTIDLCAMGTILDNISGGQILQGVAGIGI